MIRIMIDAPADALPPLVPPAIFAPAPREVSFGLVSGRAPRGTRRVIVRIGERILADRPAARDDVLAARADAGHRVPVAGHSRRRARPALVQRRDARLRAAERLRAAAAHAPRLDPVLARTVRSLTGGAGGTSAVYVQDLRTGRGAAWNARARFPAASTLKLAIAVTVMRSLTGKPDAGSELEGLLRAMLISSDNAAANRLEVWLAGSTSAGSGRVNETMHALGLNDSIMYGGYETPRTPAGSRRFRSASRASRRSVSASTRPPGISAGSPAAIYLAAAGKGPLLPLGVSGTEARYLLWLLVQVTDRGKLDRFLGADRGRDAQGGLAGRYATTTASSRSRAARSSPP